MSNHHNNGSRAGETDQMAPPQCLKVFIQRDYSGGTVVKFQTRFPTELEGRVIYKCLINIDNITNILSYIIRLKEQHLNKQ